MLIIIGDVYKIILSLKIHAIINVNLLIITLITFVIVIKHVPCLFCSATSSILSMDLLLLGSYTRISCTLIKWNLQLAKITIPPIRPIYPISSPSTKGTNWPINNVHVSNLNWLNFSPVIISTCILHPLFYPILAVSGIYYQRVRNFGSFPTNAQRSQKTILLIFLTNWGIVFSID